MNLHEHAQAKGFDDAVLGYMVAVDTDMVKVRTKSKSLCEACLPSRFISVRFPV